MSPSGGIPADPLAGLRPWQWPDPPGWWPPALGWWLLAGLALALVALALFAQRQRARARAPAHLARRELAALTATWQRDGDAAAYLAGLSQLLRRFVRARFPGQTAGLCGGRWQDFLAAQAPGPGWRTDQTRRLLEAAFKPAPDPAEALALARMLEHWFQHDEQDRRRGIRMGRRPAS